jgi:hypothetical protein
MIGQPSKNYFVIALLRAYGDQPLIRYVARTANGSFMVRNERSYTAWLSGRGRHDWIGWPKGFVYEYEEEKFNRLKQLYEKKDEAKLVQEWAHCRPFSATHIEPIARQQAHLKYS